MDRQCSGSLANSCGIEITCVVVLFFYQMRRKTPCFSDGKGCQLKEIA